MDSLSLCYNLLITCFYTGPDPPNISAPKVVVTGIHQSVRVSCSVQETAKVGENSEFELEWKGVRLLLYKNLVIWMIISCHLSTWFSKMTQLSHLSLLWCMWREIQTSMWLWSSVTSPLLNIMLPVWHPMYEVALVLIPLSMVSNCYHLIYI